MTEDSCFQAPQHVHTRPFQGELVILDLAGGQYFALEPVAARIWQALEAGRTLAEVTSALVAEYDVDVARLEADVRAFAADLVDRGLMVERARPSHEGPLSSP